LEVTFDCGGESTEAGTDDDDFDAGFGLGFSVGSVVGSHFEFCGLCFGGAKGQFMQTTPDVEPKISWEGNCRSATFRSRPGTSVIKERHNKILTRFIASCFTRLFVN
jgi:hypothetical protein